MHKPFSILGAFRFGWEKTKSHNAILFKVVITIFGLQLLQLAFQQMGPQAHVFWGLIVLCEVVVGIGAVIISLKIAKNEHAEYRDLLPRWNVGMRYIVASLAAGVIAVVGFFVPFLIGAGISAVIPSTLATIRDVVLSLSLGAGIIVGVYLALRFSFVKYAAIDGTYTIQNILKRSWRMTHGAVWYVFLLILALVVINLLGVALLFVGLLVTLPVSLIASAHVYLILLKKLNA